MATAHDLILVAGALFLCASLAGIVSARIGTPSLLVFIFVGMLAGEDGPGRIVFDDFGVAYFVGSLALAAILFQGGLSSTSGMMRMAFWPSVSLATLGVGLCAAIVGGAGMFLLGLAWPEALLLGAAVAPTDAAAVTVLLRQSRAEVPMRVVAALEVESGFNDPMAVFLTMVLVEYVTMPGGVSLGYAAWLLVSEMVGGALIGVGGGLAMVWLFRRLAVDGSAFPVLAVGAVLALFGGAQMLGVSGFLAVYLAGTIVRNKENPATQPLGEFFGALGWLAQISLFLMLGLLVTPHELPAIVLPALAVAAVLIVIARPIGVFASIAPFRWTAAEGGFIAWVGLRGAVPIYLTAIPLLSGVPSGRLLFNVVFVVVIASVVIQGWTIAPAARVLRLKSDGEH